MATLYVHSNSEYAFVGICENCINGYPRTTRHVPNHLHQIHVKIIRKNPIIEKNKEALIAQEALEAFNSIGCSSWGRVDFMMDKKNDHYFIEVNTSPGMTSHSLVPMAAKEMGTDFDQLVLEILKTANVK